MEFRTIAGGTQPFVVSQEGEGPDIVLLHGFPDTPHSFADLQRELVRNGWRVTVPWLRGYHPDTIVPGRPYDFETIGRDGLALLDAIGAQRAVVVGHDWGALTTYVMATIAPERTRGIVTIAIPHPSRLKRTPASLFDARHFIGAEAAVGGADRQAQRLRLPGEAVQPLGAKLVGARARRVRDAHQAGAVAAADAAGRDRLLPRAAARRLAVLDVPPDRAQPRDRRHGRPRRCGPPPGDAELFPAPSKALIVDRAGHWPHREDAARVLPEIVAFAGAL